MSQRRLVFILLSLVLATALGLSACDNATPPTSPLVLPTETFLATTPSPLSQTPISPDKVAASSATYTGHNASVIIICQLDYLQTIGAVSADVHTKFIAFSLEINDRTRIPISISPSYFSLYTTKGDVFNIANATFELAIPLQPTTLSFGTTAKGGIVFLVGKDVIPTELVWKSADSGEVRVKLSGS